MRTLLLLLTGAAFAAPAIAQPVVTIAQIQAPVSLPGCNDSSTFFRDTVIVRGIVVTQGGLAQSVGGNNIWIEEAGGGPYKGLDVFGFTAGSGGDPITGLYPGDSVEITGYIDEFSGESEIRPTYVQLMGSTAPPVPKVVDIADLNDDTRNNRITTGEQWEGSFVEIQECVVVTVDFFGTPTPDRVSFVVRDQAGNLINISDRFLAQRQPSRGGTFVPPVPGDSFCYIRGVLLHSRNVDNDIPCSGFSPSGRGYEIHPFDSSHYGICSAAPAIFNVSRNPVTPTSSQPVVVSADITDADGITSATLYYTVGLASIIYTPVTMTLTTGVTWEGTIPAQSDGSFVKYYVGAVDGMGNDAYNKDVPSGTYPYWYWVHDTGTEIYDVQYVPSAAGSGVSGYLGYTVTVEGVVTASAEPGNLGYVFIQQEGKIAWAGLMLVGDPSINSLTVGQKVEVTGTIEENFGFTRMDVVSVTILGSGTIPSLDQSPDLYTTYDFSTNEAYESMLINLRNSTPGGKIYVVDWNADDPSNFAEYRIGDDAFDPATGTRMLAGRQTSSANSSLNVSYVNDSSWATVDGTINPAIPLCIVYDGMEFDSITGIMQYTFSNMKMTPRNNDDYYGNSCALGIKAHASNEYVNVFPNPATDRVQVRYNLAASGNASVSLMDLQGRTVSTHPISGIAGETSFDVSRLPAGAYIVAVSSESGALIHHSKVMVVK